MKVERNSSAIDSEFATPVLRAFAFLELRGYSIRQHSVANEATIAFRRGACEIVITFDIPDVPFVLIRRIGPRNGQSDEIMLRLPRRGRYRSWVGAFETERDRLSTDVWLTNFRRGRYRDLMESLIGAYAAEIAAVLPQIEAGDLGAAKREFGKLSK